MKERKKKRRKKKIRKEKIKMLLGSFSLSLKS
jgi:hypothetical protein